MKNEYLIVVKVGSNVLTRPDGMLDVTRLSSIVDQIAELRRRGVGVILVSSGAVASGRSELRDCPPSGRLDSVGARQLFSAVGQAKLINRYYEFFREHGLHCGQVLATKENFSNRRNYLNQQHCIRTMLDNGVIPIVNENDTVSVTELMFTDNDELSGLIASMMNADRLLILSNIDGLYTDDPNDPEALLITRVEPSADISDFISSSHSSLGRGGMGTKCRTARRVAAEGIEVIIANGKREGIITALAVGENSDIRHTLFVASERVPSGIKKWIAHSDGFAKGSVKVNAGCADALRRGASLLPVGVENVDGEFDAGDIITVFDAEGNTIAWGKAACGADSARRNAGLTGKRAIVHADYLYVTI